MDHPIKGSEQMMGIEGIEGPDIPTPLGIGFCYPSPSRGRRLGRKVQARNQAV